VRGEEEREQNSSINDFGEAGEQQRPAELSILVRNRLEVWSCGKGKERKVGNGSEVGDT